jgi:hypothetical protein
MSAARQITDHNAVRKWVDERGGRPARVADTAPGHSEARRGSSGILRIDFAEPDESLERISWEEFFDTFEKHKLAFLCQDDKESRFVKFVRRG